MSEAPLQPESIQAALTAERGPAVTITAPALLWSRETTAAALAVSTSTLDRWARSGVLGPRAVHLGGKVLYVPDEIARWVALRCPSRLDYDRAVSDGGAFTPTTTARTPRLSRAAG